MKLISNQLFQLSDLLTRAGVHKLEDVLHVELEYDRPPKLQLEFEAFRDACDTLGIEVPPDEGSRRIEVMFEGVRLVSHWPLFPRDPAIGVLDWLHAAA